MSSSFWKAEEVVHYRRIEAKKCLKAVMNCDVSTRSVQIGYSFGRRCWTKTQKNHYFELRIAKMKPYLQPLDYNINFSFLIGCSELRTGILIFATETLIRLFALVAPRGSNFSCNNQKPQTNLYILEKKHISTNHNLTLKWLGTQPRSQTCLEHALWFQN